MTDQNKPQKPAKPKKMPRPKALPPKGFRDYFGTEVTARQEMLSRVTDVYRSHGFEALESSAVETVEALGKFLPDVDRPNEGVFAWRDEDESWMALRYDLTAPLARVFAQHRNDLPLPYRRYAFGTVWRNEKPGPGRFRQFYQCDADTVGSASMAADAEMAVLLAGALEAAGIERTGYEITLNNRKLLTGAMQAAGVYDPAAPESMATERGIVLRAIDKIDRLGEDGVRALLGEGRKDASGDFTKGAGLSGEQAEIVMAFVTAKGTNNAASLTRLRDVLGHTEMGRDGADELDEIGELAMAMGLDEQRLVIDPGVVRGLGYYTGPVVEAALTHEIRDEKGNLRQFGSVAGGGRYDDLVKRFTGQAVPATGVSLGVDRLMAALAAAGEGPKTRQGPVVITVMDKSAMTSYQAMAAELRKSGIAAEVYLGNPKNFGNQLKYADKRKSPVAVIQGEDERANGMVQIKDLILGAQVAETASVEEWKSRPSQLEVPRADLVQQVRMIMERYA